jgi:hypothetical protein
MRKIEKIVAHDIEVYADVEMDNLRRERCLCLNCREMDYCHVAKTFLNICEHNNIALMVTRCREYKYK